MAPEIAQPDYDRILLEKLVAPGVLGNFNKIEISSVVATHAPSRRTINVLTHLVLVETTDLTATVDFRALKFGRVADWSFGLARHSVDVGALTEVLDQAIKAGEWRNSIVRKSPQSRALVRPRRRLS